MVGFALVDERRAGLLEVIKNDPKFKIIASKSGDFTLGGGNQVMEAFIEAYGNKINVVYAHNNAWRSARFRRWERPACIRARMSSSRA